MPESPAHQQPIPKARRGWLIVGAIAVLLLAGLGVAVTIGLRSDHHAAAQPRKFTRVPPGCGLVKPATVAPYVPSAHCTADAQYNTQLPNGALHRSAYWEPPESVKDHGRLYASLHADLSVTPLLRQFPTPKQELLQSARGNDRHLTDARQVRGLGDWAYITYRTDYSADNGTAELRTNWGNATLEVTYDGYHIDSHRHLTGAVDQRTAEAAVLSSARDIYAALN
ncbi:hypothetical protein J4573_11575 [Actinomadura barringtoniae]|uniref:Uncharacterized protein n=1 Tax=Actinomadura barringtoniae TaxID=1427535 RepID=A0A939P8B6_9ACTN|nr:hypothetical protein [Actinomadura barringtoniae]MBO2447731.1 hypothetical protein [Actinomadura barringtoniae]